MPQLSTDVANALEYFVGDSIRRNAPASEQLISNAEQRLGLTFPPSLHGFLQVHNGLILIDYAVLPVPPLGAEEGIVAETLSCRQVWQQDQWIAVAHDGSGDVFVLLTDRIDERGEHPVAKIDHETGNIMFIVGSCYERFLWFLLDKLQRQFAPDGKDKGLWDYPEDDEEEWEEPSFPWPYADKEWMKQHDPHLARWLGNGHS